MLAAAPSTPSDSRIFRVVFICGSLPCRSSRPSNEEIVGASRGVGESGLRNRPTGLVPPGGRIPAGTLATMVPERFQPLLEQTAELAERFTSAGKRLYLVGGVVRDALLDRVRVEDDLDFTTDARPEEIEAIVAPQAEAVWLQGKRFGTIGCRWRGRSCEITTHRAEAYQPDSRKPDVQFSDTVESDLSRRDFTV